MIRFVKHYSTKIELPIYKFNNSTFMFDSITIEDDSFMITGSVHDLHEAETSRMIITQQNEVVVYGAHDYIEDTNHFDLDLIKNFVQFFKDNIFIKYCDSKHTITNKIMLSLDDSKELMNWARSYQMRKEEEMYRKEINKVLEYYGKKDGYYTKYPEVGDNWEYIDNIVAEVVKNIKAKKKAAAAAKRAARE